MKCTIDPRVIGGHLRTARKQKKLKQADVAEALEMQTNSYGCLERGSELPSLMRIIQCSELFDILPGDLINDCSPDLVARNLHSLASDRTELRDLIDLLSRSSDDFVHAIHVCVLALQKDKLK